MKTKYESLKQPSFEACPNTSQKKEDSASPAPEEEPRVFALQKYFPIFPILLFHVPNVRRALYQRRLDKKRAAEVSKRNRERLQNPSLFPSVPKDLP
jgi:hypothetical protein